VAPIASGGGFKFASIHNVQPNVPGENVVAMWDSIDAVGLYDARAEAAAERADA